MASATSLRLRRSAAQLHALEGVEREIRANDHNNRRKYLKDFSEAFCSYESVLDAKQLRTSIRGADVILIGDYHALPASQNFAARLLDERITFGDRPVVLGIETVFSRDQHILDEWYREEIDQDELRERMRFDLDWGYDWGPFYQLIEKARSLGAPIYGLDCIPREDLRKIGARDRHAAEKLVELRDRHPDAVIVVVFGESHLAPGHLPLLLQAAMPNEHLLTVLQNIDALYWRAAGELEHVAAVKVNHNVICVFNSTPLEKYENYRLCLDRWSRQGATCADLGPTIYNLIDGLLRFLGIDRYSSHNGTQPKFLVDLMPEVYSQSSDALLRKLLSRKGVTDKEKYFMLARIEDRGSAYLPRLNAFYTREFRMVYAAEEAARFLHHACRGLPARLDGHASRVADTAIPNHDKFYAGVFENMLAYFGSRVLDPARPAVRDEELYAFYDQTREDIEQQTSLHFSDQVEIVDFLVLHRQFEINPEHYDPVPPLIQQGVQWAGARSEQAAEKLGYILGSDLYDAYLEGRVTRGMIRQLFLTRLESAGEARYAYFNLAYKLHSGKKRPRGERHP
jgi:hypothetical protein